MPLPCPMWCIPEIISFTCSQDTQEKIRKVIEENELNRVVVAACSPRTHEPLFQDTIRSIGLNKYLFEMANIRDQDSWVHQQEPAVATAKAKDLVRMAVGRASLLKPLIERPLEINQRGLDHRRRRGRYECRLKSGKPGF